MSAIIYSGGTIHNDTFVTTTGTRQEVVTGMEAALSAAGWSTISGGGSGTVIMKSAVTAAPKSNSIRVRLHDPGSGNCAQIRIQNDAGTLTSNDMYLLPAAGKTFRAIANKYNFFFLTAQPSAAREFVCGGTLHIPDFLDGVTTGDLGWIQGNASSDAATSINYTIRTQVSGVSLNNTAGLARCSQIWNAAVTNCTDDGHRAGHRIKAPSDFQADATHGLVWSDDTPDVREAVLGFGSGSTSATVKWRGIIHNCLVVSKVYAGDSVAVTNYEGHDWFAITDNCTTGIGNGKPGTLMVAIT